MDSDTAMNDPQDVLASHAAILDACLYADWQQVVQNGGPPCFHLDGMTFCLRAERWPGHGVADFHKFVSLHDFVKTLLANGVDPANGAASAPTSTVEAKEE